MDGKLFFFCLFQNLVHGLSLAPPRNLSAWSLPRLRSQCLRSPVRVLGARVARVPATARAYTVLTGTVPPPRGAGAPLRTPQRPGAQGAGEAIPRINVHQYECQNAGVVRDVLGPGLGGTFRASIRGPLPDARIVARGRAADPTVRSDA